MAMTDPISDLLTRIRNAHQAGHDAVEVPYSRVKNAIVKILQEEGFLAGYKLNEKKPFSTLTVLLKYTAARQPAIQSIRRISKPGCRVYASKDEIPRVLGGLGVVVLSTSSGVMTGKKATERGLGGELLCEVY
ncbi:MAG: 30S ribosomal protein S8 [Acidobacteria bacterium]|nr:MAG: 30S ribosomal protein S8 [Acidobacteriota bacterium]